MEIEQGSFELLGVSFQAEMTNFALFSSSAQNVTLGLFCVDCEDPVDVFKLNRTGDIWHIAIKDVPEKTEYAFQMDSGPWVSDPYTRSPTKNNRSLVLKPAFFDWQGIEKPQIPLHDLIIYEMHVRGFTKHSSSGVSHPGTYLGIIEKIPYLKKLGINAVELMPIYGFDQTHCKNINPITKQQLVNFWGYNPLHFFAPMGWYAFEDPILEFKTLVRELHRAGIEVILDVVYNHTGEGKERDYIVNFKGIDASAYYLVDEEGKYRDFTGCGNTINSNHPVVKKFILDSLRFWVEEMRVDGFRFDLASIFTRDLNGDPKRHPPIIEAMVADPLINKVKLIAEPWDAVGLYQLGVFAEWENWSEWNGYYRDAVRRFLKGTSGIAADFSKALCGSDTIFAKAGSPTASINFITAHDGFTLRDLVSYQEKLNFENGETNLDGNNQNDNWNCGCEGPTDDAQINSLRERQMRNFLLALFLAQGVPMLLMGDEYGHTRKGNNNAYVQDNEINWFLWDQQNPKIFNFVSSLIAFRKKFPQFRHTRFLTEKDVQWQTHWDSSSRIVAFTLKPFFIAFNAGFELETLTLPTGVDQIVHTSEDWEFNELGKPISSELQLPPYSAFLGVSK